MEEVKNMFITIKHNIDGFPVDTDFEVKSEVVCLKAGSGHILLKNLCVSIDPYQINRMKTHHSSHNTFFAIRPIVLGQAISAYGVAEVMSSDDPQFKRGELVEGAIHWAQYSLVKPEPNSPLNKLDNSLGFPLTYRLGILGFTGLTAYAGLFEVAKIKKGDKVFVSAASGAVGSLVGQLAKLHGCYVVGCAGSDDKVALLREKLGFDEAFNYKQQKDFKSTLAKYFPNGIDIYFDNVGNEMLHAAISNMNPFGKVAVCGAISEYTNSTKPAEAAPNMADIMYKRITIQGFLVSDYVNVLPDYMSVAVRRLRSGEIKAVEDISVGVEAIPSAFIGLFHGKNIGKKVVKLA